MFIKSACNLFVFCFSIVPVHVMSGPHLAIVTYHLLCVSTCITCVFRMCSTCMIIS